MNLLREFIEIITEDTLFEDLGKLKLVDKSLIGAFKQSAYSSKDKKTKSKLGIRFGKDSDITSKIFKSAKNALETFESDKNAIGVVLRDYKSGKQIAAFAKSSALGYNKETFTIVVNGKALSELKVLSNDNVHAINKKLGNSMYLDLGKPSMRSGLSHGEMYKILTTLKNLMSEENLDLDVMVIYVDKERVTKGEERIKARRNMIPLPTDENSYKAFVKYAKAELGSRLNQYKASKAKTVDGPEELLHVMSEDGYLDKINISGIGYSLKDDRINLKGLKGDRFYGDSYVEYYADKTDKKWKELSDKAYDVYRKQDKGEITKEQAKEMLQKFAVPSSFKIILRLEGGKIVPDKLEFPERFDMW